MPWPLQTRALALALALAGFGCGDNQGSGELDATSSTSAGETETGSDGDPLACADPPALPPAKPPVPWQTVAELDIAADGSSTAAQFPVPAGQRYLAIRTVAVDGTPDANAQLCHGLLEARLVDADSSLIAGADQPLLDSDQRHLARPGAGIFVFSNTEAPLLPDAPDTVSLRLQLRNCLTQTPASRAFFPGMPTRVRVELASEDETEVARLGVRMLVAEDSGWGPPSEDPELAAAWDVAAARFDAAGLSLELEAATTIPSVGVLDYDAAMIPLRALHDQALACLRADQDDERFVPVVAVPCLRLDEPGSSSVLLGQTPHIPGLFDETTSPAIVVISSDTCMDGAAPSLTPERYGLILAHELGHYLGLHHSDTALGQHLASDDGAALMGAGIFTDGVEPGDAYFSLAEAAVLRRHPDVVP